MVIWRREKDFGEEVRLLLVGIVVGSDKVQGVSFLGCLRFVSFWDYFLGSCIVLSLVEFSFFIFIKGLI